MILRREKVIEKGWICLDIDGTITHQMHSLPSNVSNFLKEIYLQGWNIVFVTGRMFSLGIQPLKDLTFPFYFIPQNGASWYEMPSETIGQKKYLQLSTLLQLEGLFENTDLDFVLITGKEYQDRCFYRPHRLRAETAAYFEKTLSKLGGQWIKEKDFKHLPYSEFAYAKVYGYKEELEPLFHAFEKVPAIKSHLIKDSAHPQYYTLHVMRDDVDKGKAVLDVMKKQVLSLPIIAAGNDYNDETLLDIADIKIAMSGSPQALLERATLIAPPVEEEGIIPALKLAIHEVEKK